MPDVPSFCSDIVNRIKNEESYLKTVIFCRQYADCAELSYDTLLDLILQNPPIIQTFISLEL